MPHPAAITHMCLWLFIYIPFNIYLIHQLYVNRSNIYFQKRHPILILLIIIFATLVYTNAVFFWEPHKGQSMYYIIHNKLNNHKYNDCSVCRRIMSNCISSNTKYSRFCCVEWVICYVCSAHMVIGMFLLSMIALLFCWYIQISCLSQTPSISIYVGLKQ